jgi:hypothetical protein
MYKLQPCSRAWPPKHVQRPLSSAADMPAALASAALCRFCCKSLFALAIKNSFGRIRDFMLRCGGPHRLKINSLATSVT